MHWFSRLFRKSTVERQLDAELSFHLEQQIADYVAQGMILEEARRRAQIELGGVEQIKEKVRDAHRENYIHDIFRDLRYAIRSLTRDRRFALTAIFTLALGIGASTVIFSICYNLLFNAFAARDARQLAMPAFQYGASPVPVSFELRDIASIREQNHVFEDLAAYNPHYGPVLVNDGKIVYKVEHAYVTANAFDFYGVPPLHGRGIVPDDGKPGAPAVFVMSYNAWQGEFSTATNIVGKTFTVEGKPRVLVGIMPPRFQMFGGGQMIWMPFDNASDANERAYILARVKRGVSLEQASADFAVMIARLAQGRPKDTFQPTRMVSVTNIFLGSAGIGDGPWNAEFDLKQMLYILFAAVTMLLFIACGNVANLLLARATAREREIAVRSALGATRGRLTRQLLTEGSVLALGAAGLGCIFAYWGTKLAAARFGEQWHVGRRMGYEAVIGLNPAVLLFALSTTILITLLCGLAPALHVVSRDLNPRMSGASKGVNSGFRHSRLRVALVVGQLALSIVLLIGAGLLIRSLHKMTHVELGFNPQNLAFAYAEPPRGHVQTHEQQDALQNNVMQRLKSLPDVSDVAITDAVPGLTIGSLNKITVPGSTHFEDGGLPGASENLPDTLGLHLLRGRWFSRVECNSGQYLTVINHTLAHDFFGDADPVGQKIEVKSFAVSHELRDVSFQIVGVFADAKNHGILQPTWPQAYIPHTIQGNIGYTIGGALLLRTRVSPGSLTHVIGEQFLAVDHDVIPDEPLVLKDWYDSNIYSVPQTRAMMVTPLAVVGVLLVMAGIFSVMAYTVSLQTHEIGVRMALGAQRNEILRMVFRKGLGLILTGVLIGTLASFWLMRFLASQIWGVSSADPLTFSVVVLLITAVGLFACWLPARRATQVDPMTAIRYE